MIQIWAVLALVTALLGAGTYVVHSIKASGREECRAEHQEAARMAELRQRERATVAARRYEADRSQSEQRGRVASRAVAASASDAGCLSPDSLRNLNDYLREARGTGEPNPTVPGSTGHPGQK